MAQAGHLHDGELGQVGESLDRGTAGAAFHAGGERLAQELGPGACGNAGRVDQGLAVEGPSSDEQRGRFTGAQGTGDGRRWSVASGGEAMVGGRGGAGSAPSFHDTSAGSTRVAIWPGGPLATATASAASAPASPDDPDDLIQVDTLRATVSMSDWSWAS